jgi:hypothetical protein
MHLSSFFGSRFVRFENGLVRVEIPGLLSFVPPLKDPSKRNETDNHILSNLTRNTNSELQVVAAATITPLPDSRELELSSLSRTQIPPPNSWQPFDTFSKSWQRRLLVLLKQ